MIVRNGKTAVGWRLDEITEAGPVGMEMLMNPFAIVPKEENAERVVKAFEIARLAQALVPIRSFGQEFDALAKAVEELNRMESR
jgi:hypothetical protein